jgi:uncharacterized protein YbaP (TraB family)
MLNMLAAAALAAATPQPVVAPSTTPQPIVTPVTLAANSDPAIFVIRDADTTVYLFGTFHALDGKSEWFNDQVKTAFDQSNELVLETLIPDGPVKLPRSALTPGTMSVVPSASFLATTRMAIKAGRSQGMNVGNGADMVLRRAAEVQGKQVEGLETLESQLSMFSKMPPAPAAPAPKAGDPIQVRPAPMTSLSKTMTELQSAWRHGELNVFVRMLGQLEQGSPDTYRMMFTERNARWADWIAARMQAPGTVFVAVGAGHLAGKDSVLVRLAEHGIPSARVN